MLTRRGVSILAVLALVAMTVPGAPMATAATECGDFQDKSEQVFRDQGWVQIQRAADSSISRQLILSFYEGPLADQPGRSTINGIDAYVTCVPDGTNEVRDHQVCMKRVQPDSLDSITGHFLFPDQQADMKVAFFNDNSHVATVDPDVPPIPIDADPGEKTACSPLEDIPTDDEVEFAVVYAEDGLPQGVQHQLNLGTDGKGLFTEHFELHVCASPSGPC